MLWYLSQSTVYCSRMWQARGKVKTLLSHLSPDIMLRLLLHWSHLVYLVSCSNSIIEGRLQLCLLWLLYLPLITVCICIILISLNPLHILGTPNSSNYIMEWNTVYKLWISCFPAFAVLYPYVSIQLNARFV
jgi:hypothetical protein